MRTTAYILAIIAALAAGCATLLHNVPQLSESKDAFLYVMLLAGAATFFAMWTVLLLVQVGLVLLFRGPGFIDWVSPAACSSFSSWLGCSWHFFGKGGQQEGVRILGIGIAFQGVV
jgi:hypothetical protein